MPVASQPLDALPRQTDPTLFGAWLNKAVAGGARDYSASGYDMTAVGAPIFERVGADFDGAADYLRRAEANWRSGDSQGTIVAWIKRSAIGIAHMIWTSCDEAGNTRYLMFYVDSTNVLAITQRGGAIQNIIFGSNSLIADQWYRVALRSNGTAWSMFVNGVEEGLSVIQGVNNGDWLAETATRDNIIIGARQISGGVGFYFNGEIRDVRYYSEPKSTDWILHDYQRGVPDDSLILQVHDGMRDLSRYDNTVIRHGGVIAGDDMQFDGVDDYIDCGNIGNLQTISMWLQIGSANERVLQVDANEHIAFVGSTIQYTGLTPVATYVNGVAGGGTALTANVWYHLVCVVQTAAGANFELGREGANYGDIRLKDVKAFSEVKSADWVLQEYERTRGYY